MTRSSSRRRPAGLPDAADINAQLARIAAMSIEELREMWREKRKREPPAALTKDLMARALAHWLQEERLGGLETPLRRLLATVAKKGSAPSRRLKIGSVIVREYQGKAQEVLVVPGGFCWEGGTGLSEPVDHRLEDHGHKLEWTALLWSARRRRG